jgi:hypothetical protein
MPIYRHPELHGKDEPRGEYDEDGCITDGDDDIWSGDKSLLCNGEWRQLVNGPNLKRARALDVNISQVPTSIPGPVLDEDEQEVG